MARTAINWLRNKGRALREHPKVEQFLNQERVRHAVERLKRLNRKAIVSVFILVALWNIAFSYEKFPLAVRAQLFFYRFLWSAGPSPQYNATVRLVPIDDSLHWSQPCDFPTSRHLLAQLVRNASRIKHKAAVIALDIELFAPNEFFVPQDKQPQRTKEDEELLSAVRDAARNGVKVVFPAGFAYDGKVRRRIPNIYKDEELPLADEKGECAYPACAALGYINLPHDQREIPLETTAMGGPTGASPEKLKSLALAAAEAMVGEQFRKQKRKIVKEIGREEPLFGGFLPEDEFKANEIPAEQLARGDVAALGKAERSLIVIGGVWHRDQGYGPVVDLHPSPVGYMPGVLHHSNYIEAILGDHYAEAVPLPLAILIDIFIGIAVYSTFESKRALLKQAGIVVVLAGMSYVFFVNFNMYLDFVLPSLLYFVHLVYEHVKRYWKLVRGKMPLGKGRTA